MITLWNLNEAVYRNRAHPLSPKEWDTLGLYLDEAKHNSQLAMLIVGSDPVYWGYHKDTRHVYHEITAKIRAMCWERGIIYTDSLRFFERIEECKVRAC